jgi:hypothetical protein
MLFARSRASDKKEFYEADCNEDMHKCSDIESGFQGARGIRWIKSSVDVAVFRYEVLGNSLVFASRKPSDA